MRCPNTGKDLNPNFADRPVLFSLPQSLTECPTPIGKAGIAATHEQREKSRMIAPSRRLGDPPLPRVAHPHGRIPSSWPKSQIRRHLSALESSQTAPKAFGAAPEPASLKKLSGFVSDGSVLIRDTAISVSCPPIRARAGGRARARFLVAATPR